MVRNVTYNRDTLADLCERHGITKLSFFGSVLRDDFDLAQSDVDVLVEFEPEAEAMLTYFKLGGCGRPRRPLGSAGGFVAAGQFVGATAG